MPIETGRPSRDVEDDLHSAISSMAEIIEEAVNGRPYILVDAEDRENEGDVIIPAQFATPTQINFMAMHARGLICLAMTQERARALRLSPMGSDGGSGHRSAFTISIEAREGISTGISAYDRAHTIAVAVDLTKGHNDIVSPGHVFPLVAQEGGVLVRAGHTEAAVDIARLAGLNPAGVICEVMNEDGTMARLPDLVQFARRHQLKIGTIADLIAYRRRRERLVTRVHEEPFATIFCNDMKLLIFRSDVDGAEHVVLVKGRPRPDKPTLVRMHQMDFANDMLSPPSSRRHYVPNALRAIGEHDGPGVIVFIRDPSKHAFSERRQSGGRVTMDQAIRNFGVGAQILNDLGVRDIILLTATKVRLTAIEGYDLRIVERRQLEGSEADES